MAGIGNSIDLARALLDGRPTQSGFGTAYDWLTDFVGYSSKSQDKAGQLRAIGGVLTSKMPRMEGPQSAQDLALYKEMAGKVGNSTIPVSERKASLEVVEELWRKYDTTTKAAPPSDLPDDVKELWPYMTPEEQAEFK